jgi:ADP-heptose:LPS heptosyltransferase
MGGSALNWPPENFVELIGRLAKDLPVVVTGTAADQKYLDKIKSAGEIANVKWLVGDLKVFELLDILSQANSVIAPSTGVLHLAASLGTPVVGIYSPRRVEHPRRWGPKGMFTAALVPPVQEGDAFSPSVMTQIKVEDVIAAVHSVEKRNS